MKLAINGGPSIRTKPFPEWPVRGKEEMEQLTEVFQSGTWTYGPKTAEFEQKFAEYHDCKYGISVASGTVNLEMALRVLNIGSGDEVIVPAYDFISAASSAVYNNAIPIFVDVEPDTLCISPGEIEMAVTSRTRAIVAVHMRGRMTNMDKVLDIAGRNNIAIVEDCAQVIGAIWKGRKVGSIGDLGCFSFQQTKLMASGQGGIMVTNDPELAERCCAARCHGRADSGQLSQFPILGSNYAMTEFQAAVLLPQLARLEEQSNLRVRNIASLEEKLANIEGIEILPSQTGATRQAYYGHYFRLKENDFGASRELFIKAMNAEGIPTGGAHPVASNDPLFRVDLSKCPFKCENYNRKINYESESFPVSEQASREVVNLPHQLFLGDENDMQSIYEAALKIRENIEELKYYAEKGDKSN